MTTPREGAPATAAALTAPDRLPRRGLVSTVMCGRSGSGVRGLTTIMAALPVPLLPADRGGGV